MTPLNSIQPISSQPLFSLTNLPYTPSYSTNIYEEKPLIDYLNTINQSFIKKENEEPGYLKGILGVLIDFNNSKNLPTTIMDSIDQIFSLFNKYGKTIFISNHIVGTQFGIAPRFSAESNLPPKGDVETIQRVCGSILNKTINFMTISIRHYDTIYICNADGLHKVEMSLQEQKIREDKEKKGEKLPGFKSILIIKNDTSKNKKFIEEKINYILNDQTYTPEGDNTFACLISNADTNYRLQFVEKQIIKYEEAVENALGNKKAIMAAILDLAMHIYMIHVVMDANGRAIGGLLVYKEFMKHDIPLFSVLTNKALLGLFTNDHLMENYQSAQKDFQIAFSSHEAYVEHLLSLYIHIKLNIPMTYASKKAEIIIKYDLAKLVLMLDDNVLEHTINGIYSIFDNINSLIDIKQKEIIHMAIVSILRKNNLLKIPTIITNMLSLSALIIKQDFNMVLRKCCADPDFIYIVQILSYNSGIFNIDFHSTGEKLKKNPLEIAELYKNTEAKKILHSFYNK